MTNYLISFIFAAAGIAVLFFNNTLSEKLGAFYSRRFTMTFGRLAHSMRWDDPTRPFNKIMYRGFVITTAIILLIFSLAAFLGTNFIGPSDQQTSSLLQQQ
jgi:hypothetical protein